MAITTFSAEETRILRKVSWRFLWFILLLFMVNFIDRTNVGFAALTMNKEHRHLGLDVRAVADVLRGRLFPVRDPEQPHPRAGGRAHLALAHRRDLGHRVDRLHVHRRGQEPHRPARPGRHRRGRLRARRRALHHLLVPAIPPRPRPYQVHAGPADRAGARRDHVGRAHRPRRRVGACPAGAGCS